LHAPPDPGAAGASAGRGVVLDFDGVPGWRPVAEQSRPRQWLAGDVVAVGEAPDSLQSFGRLFEGQGHGSRVIQLPDGVMAGVDHCRSFPLYYADTPGGLILGPDARRIARALPEAADPDCVLEAAACGYVTGRQTLRRGLYQLEPGEMIRWYAGSGRIERARHYVYAARIDEMQSESRLAATLNQVIDRCFRRLISAAAGRPITVPLSGGLDSRLVLAKLVELNYPNLQAFSYGPRQNRDALVAKEVAARLKVRWTFVDTPGPVVREFFASGARRDYWNFADGLCSVPNNQDILPLMLLRQRGDLPADSVLVNGQTGDFISGGHIPDALMRPGVGWNNLYDCLIGKHASLWQSLKTPENLDRLRNRIREKFDIDEGRAPGAGAIIALHERWEYEERQAKYIVSGQRIYDHLGLAWQLPLWDREFVEFWRTVPHRQKFGQALYREALAEWDFAGLFRNFSREVSAWSPMQTAMILPLSWTLRVLLGRQRRDQAARYLKYIDRFGNHYASFGFAEFARHAHDLRNPVSLYVRHWLEELGLWGKW